MTIEYVNRRGDRYYVLQGKTKTGKPKYYCSKKPGGVGVERLPDGYEVREDPASAVVTVRKVRPTRIVSMERELVARLAGELSEAATIVDVDGDSIVVYATDRSPQRAQNLFSMLFGPLADSARIDDYIVRHGHYSPLLRFTLVDEDERVFAAERWCFLGSIDTWVHIPGRGPLEKIARRYLPHLGEDSFYELI